MRGLITSFITLQDTQKQEGICTETLLVLQKVKSVIFETNKRQSPTN